MSGIPTSWIGVAAKLRAGHRDAPWKDRLLVTILRAHQADHRPEWRSILLLLFWPDLEWIRRFRVNWDEDQLALWTNILWAFDESVCRFDTRERTHRIVQKLRNDTLYRLRRIYESTLDRRPGVRLVDPDVFFDGDHYQEELGREDEELTRVQDEHEARVCVRFLKALAIEGRIAERDLPLLIGTAVYGLSVRDWARQRGLPYEAVKKRRQRALRAIRFDCSDLQKI